jgi:hypothetical protein
MMWGVTNRESPEALARHKAQKDWWQDGEEITGLLSVMTRGNLSDAPAAESWVTKADPLLMDPNAIAAGSAWLEWLYPQTIVGQLDSAPRVPFATSAYAQTAAAVAEWVGEAGAKPVEEVALANFSLMPRKVAVIVVVADEIVRRGDAMAEERVGAALRGGVQHKLDATFASAAAEVTGISPAGIFADSPTFSSAGSSTANMVTDLKALIGSLTDGGISLAGAVWLMRPEAAVSLTLAGLAPNATLGVNGGTLLGAPAIVSSAMPTGTIGLVASQYVAVALGDVVALQVSRGATLDMSGGNSPTFDLFSKNSVALRCEIWANWSAAGGSADSNGQLAAALVTGATYA